MTNYTPETQSSKATYSLLRMIDLFGTGYLVQEDAHTAAAISEGFEVLMSGRTRMEADYAYNLYKTAGQPETKANDLGSLLTYDFTSEQEDRVTDFCELFDLVNVPYNGMWIEGTVTDITEDYIEIDGYYMVAIEDAIKGELIAKADADSGFMKTYGAWLTELNDNMETLITYAVSAQSKLEYREAA